MNQAPRPIVCAFIPLPDESITEFVRVSWLGYSLLFGQFLVRDHYITRFSGMSSVCRNSRESVESEKFLMLLIRQFHCAASILQFRALLNVLDKPVFLSFFLFAAFYYIHVVSESFISTSSVTAKHRKSATSKSNKTQSAGCSWSWYIARYLATVKLLR